MSSELKENNEGNSFEYRLREVTDDEIISILRYRAHFQTSAVNSAIKEALKRGILNSVDDLDSDEFKPQELPPKSFFPLGNHLKQNLAILKSLSRIFYGFGIIPLIYSYYQFTEKNAGIAILSIATGVILLYLANRIDKTQKPIYSFAMLGLNILSVGFALYKLQASGLPSVMDIAATIIILFVVLYTTIYAHKITIFIQKETISNNK
jgi:hypothetical protein